MREINYDSIKAKRKKKKHGKKQQQRTNGRAQIREVKDLIVLRLYFDTVKERDVPLTLLPSWSLPLRERSHSRLFYLFVVVLMVNSNFL